MPRCLKSVNVISFARRFFALIPRLHIFLMCSLDKITHNSGGVYECVFLTEPAVKQTIEVKSKLLDMLSIKFTVVDSGAFAERTQRKNSAQWPKVQKPKEMETDCWVVDRWTQ